MLLVRVVLWPLLELLFSAGESPAEAVVAAAVAAAAAEAEVEDEDADEENVTSKAALLTNDSAF